MIVNRVRDQASPATLTIYMSSPPPQSPSAFEAIKGPIKKPVPLSGPWATIASSTEGTAPAPPPVDGETVITINMKNVESHDILKQFLQRTGAREVVPSDEDASEIKRLSDLEQQSEIDRAVQKAFRDNIQQEKKMLERARQEANALKADQ